MKAIKNIIKIVVLSLVIQACDHEIINMETIVHPDGSLDRTIILEKVDSSMADNNYFGINSSTGWEVEMERIKKKNDTAKSKKNKKYVIRFRKHFDNYEVSNQELNAQSDTLFKIKSTFEKNFRWFYTYLHYTDTYGALDRLHHISQEDFFTLEDYAFIDRMGPEDDKISKADSIYLEQLGNKIIDLYFSRGIFEEEYNLLFSLLKSYNFDRQWFDTLENKKETLFDYFSENKDDQIDFEDDFALIMAEKLAIPLPYPKAEEDYAKMKEELNSRISFMYFFNNTHHFHNIKMPWTVVSTNADSVAGAHLVWKPSALKFMLQDYEMYAESRKMNYWAVILSVIIVAFTFYLLIKKKKN